MKILTLLLMLLFITAAHSQNTWTNGNATGVWSDDGNWSNGAIPDGFEAVIFDGTSTDDCFIDIDPGMTGVGFSMLSTYTGTVTVSDGVTFESGVMIVQGGRFVMGDGTFSSAGINMNGSSVTREFDGTNASQITISGNLNIGTSLSTFRATANTTNGTTLTGTFAGTGTFVNNSGKFRFSASSTRTVLNGLTFYQLELFNSISGVVQFTFGTSVGVTNLLIISGNSSASNISFGTGTINLSGNLDVSSFSSTTAGGTLSGTINFTGTGVQSITGTSTAGAAKLPNITINKSGGSLSLGTDNISIAGNFTYTAGTVNANTSTVYFFGTKNINSSGVIFNNATIGHTSLAASSTLTSAMYVAGNLNIASGSTLTTNSMGLTMEGDVTNLGTFTPGTSTITLSGSNSQAIDLRNSSTVTIHTLIINKGTGTTANINDTIIISDLLTSTAGTLNANNRVQLQSNVSKTAQVGPVTGTLSGNFIIQRFIGSSTTPKWRFIAAPISSVSNASVRNNWQSGMFITGAGTGTGPVGLQNYNSNGFDWTLSNSSSMYTYIENQATDFNSRWTTMGNPVTTSLSAGTGYRAYVRGDRSASGRLDGTVTTQNAVTLNVTGNLVTGNQTLNTTCSNGCTLNDGWNLLGNPFAATFDWQSVTRNNVDATIYVYNPLLNLYCTFTSGGSGTNGGSRYISSGQGFFVKCNSTGGGSIVIEEADKSPSNANDMYKTSSTANELRVFLNNATNTVKDEMLTGFHPSASRLYDGETDAYKMGGGFGSISSTTAQLNTLLAVNKINPSQDFSTDTVIVKVNLNGNSQTYSLNFSGVSSFEEGTNIYLHDNFLNTTVDVATTPVYTFSTVADTNSYGKRFQLLFGHLPPLPASYKSFDAEPEGNHVDVTWITSEEYELDGFDIERSTDGVAFTKIGHVTATGNTSTETSYSFTDGLPLEGANYYRLKHIGKNGNSNYSTIVLVDFTIPTGLKEAAAKIKVSAYPVPATDELNVNFTEAIKGDVKVSVWDPFGSPISSHIATVGSANTLKQDISTLESGVYFMQIKTGNSINIQVKFIKD
jgi:hypothetical protein